jgi:apolipoprotein N-acyltransferase
VALIVRDQPAERFANDEASWLAITSAYASEVREVTSVHPGLSTVVLPEKLAVLQPTWRSAVLAPLAKAARVDGVRIVAGFEDDARISRNIAITFEPNGSTTTYAKRMLLASEGNLTAGSKPGLLGSGLAVEICKDMDFPQLIRSDVAGHRVGLVFVPAEDFNIDGWMHARVAVMRGVEDGFAVARSARKGDLTVSDDRGQVLAIAASSPSHFVVQVVGVAVGSGDTPYLGLGDVFAWLCLGFFVAACGLAVRGSAPREIGLVP